MKNKKFPYLFLTKECNIDLALKYLEKSQKKIIFIIDKKNTLLGSVNDGDIRRGLLKGYNEKTKLSHIYNKNVKYSLSETINQNKIEYFKKLQINTIPIVSKTKKIKNLIFLDNMALAKIDGVNTIIMAGGKGVRLRPHTFTIPKPLVKIEGKSIIERNINNLVANGINNIIVSVNYKKRKIKDFLSNGDKFNCKISYLEENKPLGTIGCIKLIDKKILQPNLLVMNCDLLTSINYKSLLEFHVKNKSDFTIVGQKYTTSSKYGVLNYNKKKFINITEKPSNEIMINLGVYVFKNKLIKLIKKNESIDAPNFIERIKNNNYKIIIYPKVGDFFDLTYSSDLNKKINKKIL